MTNRISLSIALGDYDINRPLIDGHVVPQGISLIPLVYPSPQRHWRMLVQGEFDVCEMSMGSYVARLSRGEDDLVAIPVFPHRRFRHGYVFVSEHAGIVEPAQLEGCTVGLRSWQTTAGVWLRGLLCEGYGVALEKVRWLAQDAEDIPLELPAGVALEQVAPGTNVADMCVRGEIEGLVYPEIPRQVLDGSGDIRRLFPDPRAEERRWFGDTGIFPIMHTVVVRREVLDVHPWVARNLMDAFEQSKRLAYRRLEDPRTVSLAWLRSLVEEERALLGADPWRYGLDDANRRTLETFLRYARAQGLASEGLGVEALFHPAVRSNPPSYV